MENEDADVDINLLSELLELAENDDKGVNVVREAKNTVPLSCGSKDPAKHQSFDSVLEDLDKIPVNSTSRSTLGVNKSNFLNREASKGELKTGSAVHSGETDSSDDEEARKYGSSLDGFGPNIKHMLKTAEEEKQSGPRLTDVKSPLSHLSSWKSRATGPSGSASSLCLPARKITGPMDVYTDSSIGIRIINPLVSSCVIKERLVGRKVVYFSQVKQFTSEGKITDDWVIFGVIVSKSPPRTSAKGTTYSIIKLSDLRGPGNPKMVSLFLFSSAFKKYGKESVGTVIGILNPGVLDNNRNHGDEACLSVDNSDRIMILGTSKDFGLCKSKKKNGENCTSVVNLAQCEYCVYHVKQEYQKCSRRSDIQSSFNGPGLANLRNKVLGKNEVFYGGQSFSAIPAMKNKKLTERDQNRLMALSGAANSSLTLKMKPMSKSGLATSVELSHRQSKKDFDRLRKLTGDDDKTLLEPGSDIVTAQFNKEDVKADEAKDVALALIAKKKSIGSTSLHLENTCDKQTSNDFKELSSSSIIKDAAVMSESVPDSRGVMATLALNKKKSLGEMTASSLGLGRSIKSGKDVSNAKEGGSTSTVLSPKLNSIQPGMVPTESPKDSTLSASKTSSMHVRPSLSSGQLRKLASNGMDLESRMLKQAAQKAAFEEEAAKLNPNATPSMLGLGRKSASVQTNGNSPSSLNSLPMLGKGLSSSSTIDLTAPISKKITNAAKFNAISIIKRKGGLSKKDPNHHEFESRKKGTKENQGVKRPRKESPDSTRNVGKKLKQLSTDDEKDAEATARKAKFKELMEATSRHSDLIDAAENEAQETYFGKLEKKEQMEEKMLNTFKVACKAVRCLTCKYISFSASERCKAERHPLKVMDATKRFFKCADCGNRTVCLELIPLVSCSNCSGSRWERTAMIRERKVGVSQEILSVRGMEETFIGTVTTGANVNLLVPEEGT